MFFLCAYFFFYCSPFDPRRGRCTELEARAARHDAALEAAERAAAKASAQDCAELEARADKAEAALGACRAQGRVDASLLSARLAKVNKGYFELLTWGGGVVSIAELS